MLTVDFQQLGIRAGERILDIGCGFGRHAYGAGNAGAFVVACDLAVEELKEVRNTTYAMELGNELPEGAGITAVNGSILELPFESASFDRVVASEVIEHIDEDQNALTELVRVLRPGGTMAVTVPAYFPEKLCWMFSDEYHAPKAEGGHVRIYTKKELAHKLALAGLTVTGGHRAHALHSPYWWLRCLVGPDNDKNKFVKTYHKFLCWEIMKQPAWVGGLEKGLNSMLGKSLVIYAQKLVAAPVIRKVGTATDNGVGDMNRGMDENGVVDKAGKNVAI